MIKNMHTNTIINSSLSDIASNINTITNILIIYITVI